MSDWRGGVLLLLLLALGPVRSQTLVDPASPVGQQVVREFDKSWNQKSAPRLRCSVRVYPSRLSYDFQMWNGFEVKVPWAELPATEVTHGIALFRLREKSEGARPVYIAYGIAWPAANSIPKDQRNLDYAAGFGYLLGKGTYEAQLLLADREGRLCREEWKIAVKPSGVDLALAPGQVSLTRPLAKAGDSSTATRRKATVLLHATPYFWRRNATRLSPWDRAVLLTTLSGFARRGPYTDLRVVAYDLLRRSIVFETDSLDGRGYEELGRKLRAVDLATIDYQVLTQAPGEQEFLASLLQSESARNSEAVIFIGPARPPARTAAARPAAGKGALLPAFYFALSPEPFPPDDAVTRFVKSVSGRVFQVRNPVEFSKAIEKVGESR